MMRLSLVPMLILACTLSANAQQSQLPKDGNRLLEACGEVVNLMDNHSFPADDKKIEWCEGYIEGTVGLLQGMQPFASPQFSERMTKGPLGICLPDDISIGQFARVFVKWLREHPADLHRDYGTLTIVILHSAFPCKATETSKDKKPNK